MFLCSSIGGFFSINALTTPPADAYFIDGIASVIYSDEKTDIIPFSEAQRPSLDGTMRSLSDREFEILVYNDGGRHGVSEDVDKYLERIQRENNLTQEQIGIMFKSAGYTFEEGKQQLGIMKTVNQLIEFKVMARLIVPEKDIIAYYEANPVYLEPEYYLERTVVPFSRKQTKAALTKDIEALVQSNSDFADKSWSSPFWIKESEIAEDKQFVLTLDINQVSMPHELNNGFELFRLKDKKEERPQPLAERYMEIADILRRPKYKELLDEYREELFANSSIVHFETN